MLALFQFRFACSLVSQIAIEESGLPYRSVGSGLADPGRAELLTVNPKGTVPTLAVDGHALTENVAICSYLADVAPGAQLLPDNPWDRAQTLSRMTWFASTVHISFRQWRRPERFSPDERQWPLIANKGLVDFREHLVSVDEMLANGPWIMGDMFTIADGYGLLVVQWATWAEMFIGDLHRLLAFRDRMIARPAVRRALEAAQSILLEQKDAPC